MCLRLMMSGLMRAWIVVIRRVRKFKLVVMGRLVDD